MILDLGLMRPQFSSVLGSLPNGRHSDEHQDGEVFKNQLIRIIELLEIFMWGRKTGRVGVKLC